MLIASVAMAALLSSAATSMKVAVPDSEIEKVPKFSLQEMYPGGGVTTRRPAHRTFIHPAGNVPTMEQLDFWDGFSFFRDPWVASPAITKDRDGLGPLFNARSCKVCHNDGGRGKLAGSGSKATPALLFRLLKTNRYGHDLNYGGQLQPIAIRLSHPKLTNPVKPEGQVTVTYIEVSGKYTDGSAYRLRRPTYQLSDLNYGKLEKDTVLSGRYAPAVYGMGLLDAISEGDLLVQQDAEDSNQDGISAKYNMVTDTVTQQTKIGRFGFKGLHSTLEQQVAGAFVNDIGITNPLFAKESCTDVQKACLIAASIDPPSTLDIPKKLHDLTVYMSQMLAVPKARDLKSERAQKGRVLFYQIGCDTCHTPKYVTGDEHSVKALRNQVIYPYTDLALHDMGEGLADGGVENLASGSEWRTPPLWGIGLQKRVQGYAAFLHDGRARTIEEAILWHGGEASQQQTVFRHLTADERASLIYFLEQI